MSNVPTTVLLTGRACAGRAARRAGRRGAVRRRTCLPRLAGRVRGSHRRERRHGDHPTSARSDTHEHRSQPRSGATTEGFTTSRCACRAGRISLLLGCPKQGRAGGHEEPATRYKPSASRCCHASARQPAPVSTIGSDSSIRRTAASVNGTPSVGVPPPIATISPSSLNRTAPPNTSVNTSSSITTTVRRLVDRVSASTPSPRTKALSEPSARASWSCWNSGHCS
jgi:hypothetical protein